MTVLNGVMSRRADGVEAVFSPGETSAEPGVPHVAGNHAQAPASVGVTFLVPVGQSLTQLIQERQARDGLGLSTESRATRAMFLAVWGERAAERWVEEHNAALATRAP